MCYGPTMSGVFTVVGLVATLYTYLYIPKLRKMHVPMLLLFYTGMELLQTVQYFVVNQCSNKVNIYLTEVAYLFVILQALLWNFWFYLNSVECERKLFVSAMALAMLWIMFNLASRILYTNENALPPTMSVHAAGEVCTRREATHLYWEWTFANLGNMNANFLMYLMIWFVPALVSSQYMSSILLMAGAAIGASMAFLLKEPHTFTSAWCYISVPLVLIVIFHKFIVSV